MKGRTRRRREREREDGMRGEERERESERERGRSYLVSKESLRTCYSRTRQEVARHIWLVDCRLLVVTACIEITVGYLLHADTRHCHGKMQRRKRML